MPSMLGVLIFVTAVLGGLFLFLSIKSLGRGRPIGSIFQGGVSLLFFTLAAVFGLISAHLYTYERLTAEQPVATVSVEKLAGQLFRVSAAFSDGRDRQYLIHGDQWQIDARILKWHGIALVLGFDNYYRLERLSGRYDDIEQERQARRSVYKLSQKAGLDLWSLAKEHETWLPWVDAIYGSAAYLPMVHNSSYRVTLGPSGLIARRLK